VLHYGSWYRRWYNDNCESAPVIDTSATHLFVCGETLNPRTLESKNMVASTEKKPSKTAFVTAHLQKDQQATLKTVNAAWNAEGHTGKISSTLVTGLRAKLGLTGNIRPKTSTPKEATAATASKSAPKSGGSKKAPTRTVVKSRAQTNGAPAAVAPVAKNVSPDKRDRLLAEIESDIDRLIFKLMGVGGFTKIEDEFRAARRVITRSHNA